MAQTQTQMQTHSETETLKHPHSIGIQLQHKGMPHGLGLLTTVASLPPKYRSRYLNLKTKCEIPLDLTVKLPSPVPSCDVPVATTFTEVYTENVQPIQPEKPREVKDQQPESEPEPERQHEALNPVKPPTPPQSPTSKRKLSCDTDDGYQQPAKMSKMEASAVEIEATPAKPIQVTDSAPKTNKPTTSSGKPSRNKATRKLKFDEETSSPVSGTIIRPLEDITDGTMQYSNGDIDPKYNIVEITEETKAELAAIKNVIGDYVCRLCKIKFEDAFGLARHRCACIVLLEYRCPECGKQFNCPANLASHRRWHKPKKEAATSSKKENRNTINQQQQQTQQPQQLADKKDAEEVSFDCLECGKKFKRAAYLRKHQLTHQKKAKLGEEPVEPPIPTPTTTTTITGSFHFNQAGSSGVSTSSASSSHSDEGVYVVGTASRSNYDYDNDYLSDCSTSTSSAGYGRLQIVEHGLTEEESIAAAALTNLRNCASVIQHTTMAH
ncbi:insulinoma-associated protein 1 [Drosophila bipectinata]|uniref:insulinoma-associated protein 1 n=1 Tax=Drosophila bipectinata TaxID=42026 RepID=UPI001C8A618C|nr:insulinoma-associated protein 1 [Drosophila bipectinata]